MWYPELLIPAILSLLAVILVVPWHLRSRNLALLSMIFWMTSLNLCHIINTSLFSNSVANIAPSWCDLSTTLQTGYNFGLPLSHLLLAKQLEGLTSLRKKSVLFDQGMKRRSDIVDLTLDSGYRRASRGDSVAFVDDGCFPATFWNVRGLILMAIIPMIIAATAGVFTVMALVNIYLRRSQMLSMISNESKTSKDQFIRLFALALAEYGTCLLRAIFNATSFANGPQPLGRDMDGDGPAVGERNLWTVGTLEKDEISEGQWQNQLLQWYTVCACSVVFFVVFITASETLSFYRRLLSRIIPCIPAERNHSNFKKAESTGHSGSSGGFSAKSDNSAIKLNAQPADRSHGTITSVVNLYNRSTFNPDPVPASDPKDFNELESGIIDPFHSGDAEQEHNQNDQYALDYSYSPRTPAEDDWEVKTPPSSAGPLGAGMAVKLGPPTYLQVPGSGSLQVQSRGVRFSTVNSDQDHVGDDEDEAMIRTAREGSASTVDTTNTEDTAGRWRKAGDQLSERLG